MYDFWEQAQLNAFDHSPGPVSKTSIKISGLQHRLLKYVNIC